MGVVSDKFLYCHKKSSLFEYILMTKYMIFCKTCFFQFYLGSIKQSKNYKTVRRYILGLDKNTSELLENREGMCWK